MMHQRWSFPDKYRALLIAVLLFVCASVQAQVYQAMPNRYNIREVKIDSSFQLPYGAVPSLRGSIQQGNPARLFFNTTDSTVYVWTGTQWLTVGGGATTGWGSISGSLSDQIDLLAALNARLSVSDTAAMLAPYLRANDTTWLHNAVLNHTHVSSHITDLTTVVRNLFSGGSGISYNPLTGQISWPGTGVITGLNGLNAADQTFAATGDLSINSFGTEHTFSVPYRIDSIKKSNDSVYALKGEIWRFQYIDLSGGGTGTGTDSAAYHTITPFSDSSGFTINRPDGTRDTIEFEGEAASLTTTDIPEGTNLYYTDARVKAAVKQSKAWTIPSPVAADTLDLFYTDVAITVTKLADVVRGITPSVTYQIYHATAANSGSPNLLFSSSRTATSTAGTTTTTFNDPTIPAGSFIRIITSAVSGTVNGINITLIYSID